MSGILSRIDSIEQDKHVAQVLEVWYAKEHMNLLDDDKLKQDCREIIKDNKDPSYFSKLIDKQGPLTVRERTKLENLFLVYFLPCHFSE